MSKQDERVNTGVGWLSESEADDVMRRLCGRWRDQKGSKYGLSIDGEGSLAVCTTRPSGEVIRTGGLIRIEWSATTGRVVWGKKGARFMYTIGHLDEQSLRWQSGFAAPFSWDRLPGGNDETDGQVTRRRPKVEQSLKADSLTTKSPKADLANVELQKVQACTAVDRQVGADFGSHRARLRKEFQERRREQKDVSVASGGSADEMTSCSKTLTATNTKEHLDQASLVALSVQKLQDEDGDSSTAPRSEELRDVVVEGASSDDSSSGAMPSGPTGIVDSLTSSSSDHLLPAPQTSAPCTAGEQHLVVLSEASTQTGGVSLVAHSPHAESRYATDLECRLEQGALVALSGKKPEEDDDGGSTAARTEELRDVVVEGTSSDDSGAGVIPSGSGGIVESLTSSSSDSSLEDPQTSVPCDAGGQLLAVLGEAGMQRGGAPLGAPSFSADLGYVEDLECRVQAFLRHPGGRDPALGFEELTAPPAWSFQEPLTWGQEPPAAVGLVCSQLDYYFSDANLCNDAYIRNLMMPYEGWVTLVLLQALPRIRALGADAWSLRQAVLQSVVLELDGTACYLRIRDQLQRDRWVPKRHAL